MWSLWPETGHRRRVKAKFRRGGASRVEKSWPTGTRSLRRTDWRAWEERGRPEEVRRRGGRRAAAGWYWEQCSGEGEAQGDGENASGGPGVASYREEKGREGRMAGRHGGVEVAEPAAALSAWGREERPRGRARAKGRARVAPRSEWEARGLH
jgi:hypothetical protein